MQEQMRSLAQEIIGAYEARMSSLASLRASVSTQLQELDRAHNAMGRELRADLAKGRADLRASVSTQLQEMDQAHNTMAWQQRADLARSVAGQLRELDATHQTMAHQQRDHLSKGRAGLTQVEARRSSEVEGWLKEIAGSRQAMAHQQRDHLSKGRAGLRASVSNQLQELDQAHNAMARQQRGDLSKGRADLATTVANQLADLSKGHAGLIRAERLRKSEVKTWIEDVAAIHAGARAVWQELAATMGARRSGVIAVAKAPAPAAVKAETAPSVAEAAEEELGNGGLVDQIFAYLADRPDGTKLAELEDAFGANRFEMARIIRRLTDDGKVEKRDLLYFAI